MNTSQAPRLPLWAVGLLRETLRRALEYVTEITTIARLQEAGAASDELSLPEARAVTARGQLHVLTVAVGSQLPQFQSEWPDELQDAAADARARGGLDLDNFAKMGGQVMAWWLSHDARVERDPAYASARIIFDEVAEGKALPPQGHLTEFQIVYAAERATEPNRLADQLDRATL